MRTVEVVARDSNLSRAQVAEVAALICDQHSQRDKITFSPLYVKSYGDRLLACSLKTKDKTDFFTREVDDLLLQGRAHIAVHAAKDLPYPLPQGVVCIALTTSRDRRDALVLPPGQAIEDLPHGAAIGSSSYRRDRALKRLRHDLIPQEVRGTIERRLTFLDQGELAGLIVAEAAILRLNLHHLNRIYLPDLGAPLQGQLAILAREGDEETTQLFASIDRRCEHLLYTGLTPPPALALSTHLVHAPLIRLKPHSPTSPQIRELVRILPRVTHLLFTSQNGVLTFKRILDCWQVNVDTLEKVPCLAIGTATADLAQKIGLQAPLIPNEATQEGMIDLILKQLKQISSAKARKPLLMLLPCSSQARPQLAHFLKKQRLAHLIVPTYTPEPVRLPDSLDLKQFDRVLFTSPSTVYSFAQQAPAIPKSLRLSAIGRVTRHALTQLFPDP